MWIGIGRQNRTRQNQIFANAGLGIDLDVAGIQANDNDGAAPPADYANRGQNYPVLTDALGGADTGRFAGSIDSSLGDYRIDFYGTRGGCPADDNRQAEYFIGTVTVSITKAAIGGNGAASIGAYLHSRDAPLRAGDGIMATATDGSGDTSELSACIVYQDDVIFANGFEFAF